MTVPRANPNHSRQTFVSDHATLGLFRQGLVFRIALDAHPELSTGSDSNLTQVICLDSTAACRSASTYSQKVETYMPNYKNLFWLYFR